jgi:hypothetical protein
VNTLCVFPHEFDLRTLVRFFNLNSRSKSVPGGGPVTFVYNDRDLIETTTDANSKVVQKYYDVHNRDSVVTIDGKSIVYVYDKDRLTDKSAESFGGVTLTDEYIYDAYGRIMTQNSTTIAGNDQYDFEYLHSDLMTSNDRQHPGVMIHQGFSYDNWGRQLKHQFGIEGGPSATIQANAWNKRDELIRKGLGGETGKVLQGQSYTYHIRGWLTDINKVGVGTDLQQLAACDTIPPGDPIPNLFGEDEDSEEGVYSLQDIIDRRFHEDLAVGGFTRCSKQVCDTLACDSGTRLQQLTDITRILDTMRTTLLKEETIACEGLSLRTVSKGNPMGYLIPSKLFRIRLCDGSEYYIPQALLGSLTGPYEILQEIPITHLNQSFLISENTSSGQGTLAQILPMIAEGRNIAIGNYESCQLEECLEIVPPVCDSASTTAQNAYLDSLQQANNDLDASGLSYPLDLVSVLLCNGTELYLLESELANLPGDYTVIHELMVEDEEQQFTVKPGDPILAGGILFSEKLFYDVPSATLEGPLQRNGNIAHAYWQVAGRTPKGYGYRYDPINRLLKATYGEVTGSGGIPQIIKSERYSAYGITYDADGNLETLTRNGPVGSCPDGLAYGVIDQLTYTISGNRMTSLADAATRDGYFPGLSSSYQYDGAGNMNSVGPTGVTLTYNALNLPATANNGMAWDYGADGRKIKYTGLTDETTYADGIEYVNDDTIFIYHPEGRVYKDTAGEWRFEYSLKDHLGNTRVVFADACPVKHAVSFTGLTEMERLLIQLMC